MSLRVIGVGYPRTGTLSLKHALESLGFGPCHHMTELLARPERWPNWIRAARGEPVDWDTVFAQFQSSTDAPACYFYRSLAARFTDAKFILSLRPPEKWYESARATVFSDQLLLPMLGTPMAEMISKVVFSRYEGRLGDRAYMIAAYERHNAEVQRLIPPERLLLLRAGDGWEPLCRFLGVTVPNEPYPHSNDRKEFAVIHDETSKLARQ
jgi:Sulfotransferase domain